MPGAFVTRLPIFDSLQFRDFRWMWVSSFGSFQAMNMQMTARAWLVLRLTEDSPLALTWTMVSFAVPMTFMSLIGGALADRIPRRSLVMVVQTGNALLTLLLAVLDLTGVVVFWHLIVVGFLNGSLMALNWPSRQAMISDIVPEGKLMNAISLSSSAMNLTRMSGPAAAGFLIVLMGTSGTFFLIAGVYIFSVLSVGMVSAGGTAVGGAHKSMTGDIREAFAHVFASPTLRGIVIMTVIPAIFGFAYWPLLPAWAREVLDVGADGLGILNSLMGVGALAGSLILASMANFNKRGALLLAACAVWGVGLAMFAKTDSFATAVPFLLLVGLLSSVFMSLNMTLMQVNTTREMRGRVMSIGMMSWGLMPVGAVPFGLLAENIGTPDSLMWAGILLAAFTLVFAVAYPGFRRIP